MKIEDINLAKMLDFQPEQGKLLLGRDRMLLFRQDAFATLRKLLHEQLGEYMTRALLAQFGYRCGYGDHVTLMANYSWDSETDEMSAGPVMHTWEGIVHVEPTLLEFDRKLGRFHMTGIWRNSYEAENHISNVGLSKHPVCHSLTGYASGWCSAFLGLSLLAIETMCVGVGDPHCRFEIRKTEDWGPEADPWKASLEATGRSVARELEEKLTMIEHQRAAIHALSVPIIQIWDGVVTLPIVGTVDSQRASLIMNELLAAVMRTRARYAILDLTGVEAIDMATADHFLKIVQVVKLIGAEGIITGIAPAVAKTMIALGVEISHVVTLSTLEEALKYCMKSMGYSVMRR